MKEAHENDLAEIERTRLRALVDVDLTTADRLHAPEFQLVTPGGSVLSKRDYLDAVANSEVNYLRWEPEDIEVRMDTASGCVRYRATIEGIFWGDRSEPAQYWHTDFYERRDGDWQVVWSHATQARS